MVLQLDINSKEWLDFVSTNSDASVFSHPQWIKTITDCYKFSGFIAAFKNSNGSILAGFPTIQVKYPFLKPRYISMPFSDYSQILSK